MFSLCQLYRARSAYTSVQSDQALYFWLTKFKFSSRTCLKLKMDNSKNERWTIPFKQFSRLRVNQLRKTRNVGPIGHSYLCQITQDTEMIFLSQILCEYNNFFLNFTKIPHCMQKICSRTKSEHNITSSGFDFVYFDLD